MRRGGIQGPHHIGLGRKAKSLNLNLVCACGWEAEGGREVLGCVPDARVPGRRLSHVGSLSLSPDVGPREWFSNEEGTTKEKARFLD